MKIESICRKDTFKKLDLIEKYGDFMNEYMPKKFFEMFYLDMSWDQTHRILSHSPQTYINLGSNYANKDMAKNSKKAVSGPYYDFE